MRRSATLFAGIIVVTVLVAIIAGVALIGTPSQIREIRLDRQRVNDLRQISNTVSAYVNKVGMLPDELGALRTPDRAIPLPLVDPETKEPYEYSPEGTRRYRLCTTFRRPTSKVDNNCTTCQAPEFWHHGAGRHCFTIDVPEQKSK